CPVRSLPLPVRLDPGGCGLDHAAHTGIIKPTHKVQLRAKIRSGTLPSPAVYYIMFILITGAAGFIGQLVARALLDDDANTLLLTDIVEPPIPSGAQYPHRARCIKADLVDGAKS